VAHMARLAASADASPGAGAQELPEAQALAARILRAWGSWEGRLDLPERHIHGDLKISNVRFAGAEATALIDLDTLAHGTLDVELGDAMRSWCNPAGEDASATEVDLAVFSALVQGYASTTRGDVLAEERDALVAGFAQIALELTARFLADALNERYFGWDATRFATRGEHNLLRARGQWALHEAVMRARPTLDRAVRDAFAEAP